MQRGIALLNESTVESLTEAIGFFDRAIALRRSGLVPGDHWMAYLTAASWMNRGDALTRLGQPSQLADSLQSYDEAITVMRDVPLEANPLYRRRAAIAWMNRGITLHAQGTAATFAAAVTSFEQGIALVSEHHEHSLILACAWMNRGNALLRIVPPDMAEVRASAMAALSQVTGTEQEDLIAAETGIKARHILCQAIAELLARDLTADQSLELVSAATDAVDEALRLARSWEERGQSCFRPLLMELFRFGVAAYRAHQPHFLAEFVEENLHSNQPRASLAEDQEMHALAAKALAGAAGDLHSDGFTSLNTSRFDRLLETLKTLRSTEDRLRELRSQRDKT